jgi:hypothetical protein
VTGINAPTCRGTASSGRFRADGFIYGPPEPMTIARFDFFYFYGFFLPLAERVERRA